MDGQPPADLAPPAEPESLPSDGLTPDTHGPPDDTVKIDVGTAVTPQGLAPPPPKPKPIIIAERAGDGWRTASLALRRSSDGLYLTLEGAARTQVIHITDPQLEQLLSLLESPSGALWRKLSDLPLERPLPSRALEEELRVLLTTFANEIRQRAHRR